MVILEMSSLLAKSNHSSMAIRLVHRAAVAAVEAWPRALNWPKPMVGLEEPIPATMDRKTGVQVRELPRAIARDVAVLLAESSRICTTLRLNAIAETMAYVMARASSRGIVRADVVVRGFPIQCPRQAANSVIP